MSNRVNPYTRLKSELHKWVWESVIQTRSRLVFWRKKENLGKLETSLYERTIAANELGYEVIVVARTAEDSLEPGLYYYYQTKRPERLPSQLKF